MCLYRSVWLWLLSILISMSCACTRLSQIVHTKSFWGESLILLSFQRTSNYYSFSFEHSNSEWNVVKKSYLIVSILNISKVLSSLICSDGHKCSLVRLLYKKKVWPRELFLNKILHHQSHFKTVSECTPYRNDYLNFVYLISYISIYLNIKLVTTVSLNNVVIVRSPSERPSYNLP